MNSTKTFSLLATTTLVAACGAVGDLIANPPASTKNVLFIAVDDLKPFIAAYGDPIAKTPNLDRLASRGSLFTNAYCQQAVSGPSRASLLTGTCPDRTQVWDLNTLIRSKNPDALTIPQYFRQNGYTTYGIGKIFDPRSVDKDQDVASWSVPYDNLELYYNKAYEKPIYSFYQLPQTREQMQTLEKEFTAAGMKPQQVRNAVLQKIKPSTECVVVDDDAYSDGAIANGAIQYIKSCSKSGRYFWAVGFKKPHLPFCAPKKYWDMYDRGSMPLATYRKRAVDSPEIANHKSGELTSYTDIPDLITFTDVDNAILNDDKARELIHGYYASVSYIDAQLGRLLDALDQSGFASNTVIVLWGDHGWHLGDHGLWNKHTNFEQATRAPLLICDPSVNPSKVSVPVEFTDIFPTLCQAASIPVPSGLDGVSLLPLMKGESVADFRPYASSQFPRVQKMGYTLRTNRYRYTVWVDWKNKKTDPSIIAAQELYDYQSDPDETRNLVDDKAYADALAQMRKHWEDYKAKRLQ